MTRVLIRERRGNTHTQRKRPHGNGSNTAVTQPQTQERQRLPATTGSWKRYKEGASKKEQLCQHLDFGLLTFWTLREYLSVALSHPVGGTMLLQPQEANTPRKTHSETIDLHAGTSRMGQREKVNSNAFAASLSTDPTGSLKPAWPFKYFLQDKADPSSQDSSRPRTSLWSVSQQHARQLENEGFSPEKRECGWCFLEATTGGWDYYHEDKSHLKVGDSVEWTNQSRFECIDFTKKICLPVESELHLLCWRGRGHRCHIVDNSSLLIKGSVSKTKGAISMWNNVPQP